ncbi:MAG: response regulator transcription factor [Planctomycetes bacterium]|nr:response regulator transcription factor [Planctomycetota bacterium]
MTAAGALVLVVEDEASLRRFLAVSLPAHGYRVLEAADAATAERDARQYAPDAVLLDLGLPDLDGLALLSRLRAWYAGPVIVVSARGQERQKVEALDAGADDYLTKPFGMPELLARLRAALRRTAAPPGAVPGATLRVGPLEVDVEARRVRVDGREVHLTPTEFKLLVALARRAGRTVTQRQLLEEVWGPHSVDESRYLRVYMTHLRRKLEPDPFDPRLFETEAGVGYRLRTDGDPA